MLCVDLRSCVGGGPAGGNCVVRGGSLPCVPCRAVPCRAVPCRAVPCRAVPCRVVPCRAVSCRAVSCRVVSQVERMKGLVSNYIICVTQDSGQKIALFKLYTTYLYIHASYRKSV